MTDQPKSYRIKLGPVASDVMDRLPEQTPAALDTEIGRLTSVEEGALERDRQYQALLVSFLTTAERLGDLAAVTVDQTETIRMLTELVDHRTRQFEKMLSHVSCLVGSVVEEDEAAQELVRDGFETLQRDMKAQLEKLMLLLDQRQRAANASTETFRANVEEQSLSLPISASNEEREIPVKSRGFEH